VERLLKKVRQTHEHCPSKKERDVICGKADHDHYMEHKNIIYGAIIIVVAYSLNFKCNNNRKSYSSLHMTEMQIINPKTLALQCTWCQINSTVILMCSDLCHNSCLLSDPVEWSRSGPTEQEYSQ
jgi:ABC-type Fe3+-citrate transport system substrate-binding protein